MLYASIVLPATLFAAVQTADAAQLHKASRGHCPDVDPEAYLTLTLPSGYSCAGEPVTNNVIAIPVRACESLAKNKVRTPDVNGDSPWRAEDFNPAKS